MSRVSISNVPELYPAQFIARNRDTEQSAPAAVVPSPYEWPAPGAGDGSLMDHLRWLLETYLDYPMPPNPERAALIEAALKAWGSAAFNALFNNRDAGRWLPCQAGEVMDILITCDDPELLSWPWEALCDPKLGYFGHRARIQRRLSHDVPEPTALPSLPEDRVNILLITARPYDDDVGYRSISRPLVDLIRRKNLPASVELLRPPTLDNLRRHLEANPGHYHILHFDGHGGYGEETPDLKSGFFKGNQGCLMFENEKGGPDEVTAARLATLLQGCAVPFVVLNACRSAKLDKNAVENRAFASVAGALVQAGFRGVLAMGYNLSVAGAQQFMPEFYRELFTGGNFLEAARKGRLQMFNISQRSLWNPDATLPDWLLPVVYQQREDFDLSFAAKAAPGKTRIELPEAAQAQETIQFVGRDEAIQELERKLRGTWAGVLVHGLGGIGKTTLARHFLQWLLDTGGLENPPFWFAFDDIRSADFVFNELGRALFGGQFDGAQPQHTAALVKTLRENPFLIVWDNFESARGFQPENTAGFLDDKDQQRLKRFLAELRGGRTKILITSRSEETWLPPEDCHRLALHGLRGSSLWEYAAAVIEMLDLKVDQDDPELTALLCELDGNPVLIRAVLAQIGQNGQTTATLRTHWQAQLPAFLAQVKDPAHARLLASVDLISSACDAQDKFCLIPLALHERFVSLPMVHNMGEALKEFAAKRTQSPNAPITIAPYDPSRMERLMERLTRAGLLTELGNNIFAIHPLLTSYLRTQSGSSARTDETILWEQAFMESMARLAYAVTPKELHEQRGVFQCHHANFHHALNLANTHNMAQDQPALIQSLAQFALNTRNFAEAATLFMQLAENRRAQQDIDGEAAAYHQLGMIAEEQRDFAGAERWYLKSLAISEKQGDEHIAASTYHQLGNIAYEQQDFAGAERWYLKSLAIKEKQGNEHGAASTFHHLGIIAQEQRDFAGAERWHHKSLAIFEKQGNEHGAASRYHQLGNLADELRDFAGAERWHHKSLAIFEKQGNEHGAASTFHHLGIIAQEQRDFAGAERWYLKSLTIKEKQGNEHGAASTYHQLGRIAEEQRAFARAERWYLKSLAIEEKQGNEHGAASSYHQLGHLAFKRQDFKAAAQWVLKAFSIFSSKNDPHRAQNALNGFIIVFRDAPESDTAALRQMGTSVLGEEKMREIEQAQSPKQP